MPELNGYYFRGLLKKTRRRFALIAGEQALYQELVDICNEENWCTSFQVSNGELATALNCNEKTLNVWRQSLINAGLIIYRSGKSKRTFGIYELVVGTVVKFTVDNTTNTPTDRGTNKGVNPSDYNKLKGTNLNQTGGIGNSAKPAPTSSNFKKPSIEELVAFFSKKNLEKKLGWPPAKIQEKAEKFYNFYESKGWMIGKNKMKDWQAAVCGQWLKDKFSNYGTTQQRPQSPKIFDEIDYSKPL